MLFYDSFVHYSFPSLGYVAVPKMELSSEELNEVNLPPDASNDDYLKALVLKGKNDKLTSGEIPASELEIYEARISEELDVLISLGFSGYCLLIAKLVRFCKLKGILNSPGRGSAAGVLCFWLMGLTMPNPVRHQLLFSRFLSSYRVKTKIIDGKTLVESSGMPDYDLDSSNEGKPLVQAEIDRLFPSRTVSISTVSTLTGKALLKLCLKIYSNFSENDSKNISDLLEKTFGVVESIGDAMKNNEKFKAWAVNYPEIIEIAKKLEWLVKNKGVHPAGILLTEVPVFDCLPCELGKIQEDGSEKKIVCSYDMNSASVFSIKLDNLGVKCLDSVKKTLDLVGKKISDINVEDEGIYQFLNTRSEFHGLFQISENLGKTTVLKVGPQNISQLSDCIALGRPGSLRYIPQYVLNKNEIDVDNFNDKRIAAILKDTRGLICYQEQLMELSIKMAGFSNENSNILRKIIGKKRKEEMPAWKDRFIQGSLSNGYSLESVEKIWQTFIDSSDYLFNKSHSISYAYLTAITTYLKHYHIKEFYLALLRDIHLNPDPLAEISSIAMEMHHFGMKLLPPHLLKSDLDFTIEGENIRFGLSAIKGVSEKTLERLKEFKKHYKNKFEIFEAAKVAKLNIGVLCALIQSGCMEESGSRRSYMVYEAQMWNVLTDKEKALCMTMGEEFNYKLAPLFKKLETMNNEKGKPLIKPSRAETIRKKLDIPKKIYLQNSKEEDFANWYYEKTLIGFTACKTLKEIFARKNDNLIYINEIKDKYPREKVEFIGTVREIYTGTSKKTNLPYARFVIADEKAAITVILSDNNKERKVEKCHFLNKGLPKEDDIVVVSGTKGDDCVFGEVVSSQNVLIYMKLAKIKEVEEAAETEKAA